MSTRDELEQTITDVMESFVEREPTVHDISAAVIAEGWRKMPSREEFAQALFFIYEHAHMEQALAKADAILALMDKTDD